MLSCCDYCDAGESSFEIKTEDESIDDAESPRDDKSHSLACRLSDERFTMIKSLDEPIRVCSKPKSCSCAQCEKRFSSQQSLRKHMNIQSCRFKCSRCEKCFQSNNDLTVHRGIHSGEKPFECLFVANDLQLLDTLEHTAEFTVDRNHTNATNVESLFDRVQT